MRGWNVIGGAALVSGAGGAAGIAAALLAVTMWIPFPELRSAYPARTLSRFLHDAQVICA
jgi:hypothetical protein